MEQKDDGTKTKCEDILETSTAGKGQYLVLLHAVLTLKVSLHNDTSIPHSRTAQQKGAIL
jgi:hypothetical protein